MLPFLSSVSLNTNIGPSRGCKITDYNNKNNQFRHVSASVMHSLVLFALSLHHHKSTEVETVTLTCVFTFAASVQRRLGTSVKGVIDLNTGNTVSGSGSVDRGNRSQMRSHFYIFS